MVPIRDVIVGVAVGLIGLLLALRLGKLLAALLSYVLVLVAFHLLLDALGADPLKAHALLVNWRTSVQELYYGAHEVPPPPPPQPSWLDFIASIRQRAFA